MFGIDPSKLRPVPKEDIERLRKSVREHVINPYKARQLERLRLHEEARRRPIR